MWEPLSSAAMLQAIPTGIAAEDSGSHVLGRHRRLGIDAESKNTERVIPAKAGIQTAGRENLDSRFRGNDGLCGLASRAARRLRGSAQHGHRKIL